MSKVYSDFAGKKAKNVTCILYLEDWGISYGELLDWLSEWPLKSCCSPVHDKDRYSEYQVNKWIADHTVNGKIPDEIIANGLPKVDQYKKSHVHVIIEGSGPRYADWWAEQWLPFHEVNYFEAVKDMDKLVRYMAHMDNPEKAQYSMLDIHGFGGFDLSPLLKTAESQKIHTLVEVMEYVFECNVRHYSKLVRHAFELGDYDWISCVSGRATFFAHFFKSESDLYNLKKRFEILMESHRDVTLEELQEIFEV